MGTCCCTAKNNHKNRDNSQNNCNILLMTNAQKLTNVNSSNENQKVIENENEQNEKQIKQITIEPELRQPTIKKEQVYNYIDNKVNMHFQEEQKQNNQPQCTIQTSKTTQITQETSTGSNKNKQILFQIEEFKKKLLNQGNVPLKLKETKTLNQTELVHKYIEIQFKEVKSYDNQTAISKSYKCLQPTQSMVSKCNSQKNQSSLEQIGQASKKSGINTLNFIGNDSQMGSYKSDNNKLFSCISSGDGMIPIFEDHKLTPEKLKEFRKLKIQNSLSLNEIISFSENKPKLEIENASSNFKLLPANEQITNDFTEQYLRERIKLKSSNQILESSVLDEMYKLKLCAFFMKRNNINKSYLPPWSQEFENSNLSQNFVDKEFQMVPIENQQYLINFEKLVQLTEQQSSLDQIPLKKFIAGINTSDQIFASLLTLINHHNLHTKILNYIAYPQENATLQPIISSNQRFFIKMYYNGTRRAVQLDGFGVKGYVEGCLLGRLIEKALLKMEGEMLTTDNTSAAILNHRISGWVPEEILFNEIPNKANLWSRLFANFLEGNILLVLGGNQSENSKDGTVVAVLDMREAGDNGEKKLVLLNGVFFQYFYN